MGKNNKKKMIIVNDYLHGGGVEKLMNDLVWAWHDKYDITVMTDDLEEGFEELYPSDVRYISIQSPKKIKMRIVRAIYNRSFRKLYDRNLRKNLAKENFDYAIAIKEGYKMRDVDEFVPAKYKYCWNHTDYNSHYYTGHIFGGAEAERRMMSKFDKIVCVSEDIAKGIRDVIGDPGNLIVKYNPINVENVLEKAKEPVVDIDSMELPEEERPVRFVTVGRLNQQKGYDLLLEASNILEKEGYKFEVIVVGGNESWGGERDNLMERMKRLGLKSVNFIGARQNAYKYMAVADWFLSTSIYEGYSLVSQEAALLDVPLLLTKVSGVRELIGDDEYGIAMEPSVAGIYHGMKRVLDDPSLQKKYKERIIERKKIITYEKRLKDIESMLEE